MSLDCGTSLRCHAELVSASPDRSGVVDSLSSASVDRAKYNNDVEILSRKVGGAKQVQDAMGEAYSYASTIAGMCGSYLGRIATRFDKTSVRLDKINTRFNKVNPYLDRGNVSLDKRDSRLDRRGSYLDKREISFGKRGIRLAKRVARCSSECEDFNKFGSKRAKTAIKLANFTQLRKEMLIQQNNSNQLYNKYYNHLSNLLFYI
jgi:hypothetical protein